MLDRHQLDGGGWGGEGGKGEDAYPKSPLKRETPPKKLRFTAFPEMMLVMIVVVFNRNLLSGWIAVDARFCEIFRSRVKPMWPLDLRLGPILSVCQEGSKCNGIYPG